MSYVYTMEQETVTKLTLSAICLAVLLYAAGWISAELRHKGFSFFKRTPAPAPVVPATPAPKPEAVSREVQAPDIGSDLLKSETKALVRETLDLEIPVPEDIRASAEIAAERIPFTVLDGTFWRTRISRALFRMHPVDFDHSDTPSRDHYFSVFFQVETNAEDAARISEMLREKGYDPYLIPVETLSGHPRFAIMLGDYDETGKALQAVRGFNREESLPAVVVYADPLSLSPLRDLLAATPAPLPEPEPPPAPPEPEPEIPEATVRPYTIRLACFNSLADARRAADHYRGKGITPTIMGPSRPGAYCGWVVYTGHWPERSEARRAKGGTGVSDAIIRKMPYTLLIGLYESEAEAKALFDTLETAGAGPYWMAAGEGNVRLFSGVFPDEGSAEKIRQRLAERDIPAEIMTAP